MQNTLLLIKNKVGHGNVRKWVEDTFGMDYRTFVYQVREETMRYRDILKLLKALDIDFEDLRQNKYSKVKTYVDRQKEEKQAEEEQIPKTEKLSDAFGF